MDLTTILFILSLPFVLLTVYFGTKNDFYESEKMYYFSSFAIGGFGPSAAIAGVLLLVGLGAFFYLGIKGPTDY